MHGGAHLPRRVKLMRERSRLLETSSSLATLLVATFLERGGASVGAVTRSGPIPVLLNIKLV